MKQLKCMQKTQGFAVVSGDWFNIHVDEKAAKSFALATNCIWK